MLTAYENAALMIQTGLYAPGSDPAIDEAIRLWPGLDGFVTERSPGGGGGELRAAGECVHG